MASSDNSNLSMGLTFKGPGKPNAIPVYTDNGAFLLGGFPSQSDLQTPNFGVVVSQNPSGVDGEFFCGRPTNYIPVGILLYEAGIAMNDPAKPDSYLGRQPAAVMGLGAAWYAAWTKTAPGSIDPVIGCTVIFNATTGAIEFMPPGCSAPTGWVVLTGAKVKSVAPDQSGVMIFFMF